MSTTPCSQALGSRRLVQIPGFWPCSVSVLAALSKDGGASEWVEHAEQVIEGYDAAKIRTHEGTRGMLGLEEFVESMQIYCRLQNISSFVVDYSGNFVDFKRIVNSTSCQSKLKRDRGYTTYISAGASHLVIPSSSRKWATYSCHVLAHHDHAKIRTHQGTRGLCGTPQFVESIKVFCERRGYIAFVVNDGGDFVDFKDLSDPTVCRSHLKRDDKYTTYILMP